MSEFRSVFKRILKLWNILRAIFQDLTTASMKVTRAIALMMEAASKTSVNFYQTTRCYIPENSHLDDEGI
jgi:hypothetical protein